MNDPKKQSTVLFLSGVSILIMLIAGFLCGCSEDDDGGWSPFLSDNGTGVRGLDTPEQILSNPYVEEALEEASDEGVYISADKGLDPPVISGRYSLTGEAYNSMVGWQQLSPGTWRWSNQTSNNHIDTEYDQMGLQTGSGGGEIIRGSGNRFTVYSILDIDDSGIGGCEERVIAIVDGEQHSNGDVSAVYIFTPAKSPICHGVTIGRLELTLNGSAQTDYKSNNKISLMRLLGEELEKVTK